MEDWMAGAISHSSSKAKAIQALPLIFQAGSTPGFVVAFGTTSFADPTSSDA